MVWFGKVKVVGGQQLVVPQCRQTPLLEDLAFTGNTQTTIGPPAEPTALCMLTRLLSLLSSGLLYVVSRSHTNTLKVSKFLHRQSYVLLSHLGKLPETEGFTSLVAFSVNSQEGQLFLETAGSPGAVPRGGRPPKGFKKKKKIWGIFMH